jgi:hypothetical protein
MSNGLFHNPAPPSARSDAHNACRTGLRQELIATRFSDQDGWGSCIFFDLLP